jgi:hypothetical protein
MVRVKKPKDDFDARERDWQEQVNALKLSHSAYVGQVEVQQEALKSAVEQGKKWGLDLLKLTQLSREAFEKLGREVQAQYSEQAAEMPDAKRKGEKR